MVKIIVLGEGLVPRGHGIAPLKHPFDADLHLINLIMETGNQVPYLINPINGAKIKLTPANAKKMYDRWSDYKSAPSNEMKPVLHPSVPANVTITPVAPPRPSESAKDEKTDSDTTEKSDDKSDRKDDNNKNQYDKKNKHNNYK